MPRIRTIKPEFQQSESMGRISRDARLLFVQMWTIADDAGRLRGNSRMLASLLFPYDNDAPDLIDGWIAELERENCIARYTACDGGTYIQVLNWSKHQKIDKPSESKLPGPDSANVRECSRTIEKTIEDSIPSRARADRDQDQGKGSRTKEREWVEEGEASDAMEAPTLSPLLGNLEFAASWDRWRKHRNSKHKPLSPIEAEQQLIELARHGVEEARAMVDFSILRGALNLITNGDHRKPSAAADPATKKTRGASLYAELGVGAAS